MSMNEMGFIHLSRESWSLLRKLRTAQTSWKARKDSPNSISTILHKTTNIKPKKSEKMNVKVDYKEELKICIKNPKI